MPLLYLLIFAIGVYMVGSNLCFMVKNKKQDLAMFFILPLFNLF